MSDDPLLFQRIAWRIARQLPGGGSGRAVLVTSARPAEGKSFVARALAVAFGMQKIGPVALVECSRTGESSWSAAPDAVTWRNLVVAGVQARLPEESAVTLIPWGGADPSTAFQSAGVARAVGALRRQFAFVVLDGPILLNCGVLARVTDGSVLVVDANRTRREIIAGGLQANPIDPQKLLGAVLNQMPRYVPRWLYRRAL
jgi:Mrp family chromosome partitioning ATPase